jgi:hypothetical protein
MKIKALNHFGLDIPMRSLKSNRNSYNISLNLIANIMKVRYNWAY